MSVQQALDLVRAVGEAHKGQIGTHWGDCWKYHAACLASWVEDMLTDQEEAS